MRRVATGTKQCVVCDLTMIRRRGKSGLLEKPAAFHRRQTCGLRRCRAILIERTKASIFAAMQAEREPYDYDLLVSVAAENGHRVGRCSRCGDVWIVKRWRRGGRNRKRCDYCTRNSGSPRVGYIRGSLRRTVRS